ncbi:iron chelate uptake ABC transporter family permease subunit [Xanthobacter autotrophicus]|uniref:iron chelate uptake ABC transporter family permease subunit n=1 Tax=Xanthobacter autotrophicus TaxID=280 RepID=UPI003726C682
MSETLCAMGVSPCGAAEIPGYERMVSTPPTPPGVMDVGLQGAPNMEALAALAPQLILIQAWQQQQRPRLERCAPVESLTIFTGTGDAYAHASDATRHMGELLGCPERGMTVGAILLIRPATLLALDEEAARGLGLGLLASRTLVLGVATALSACVVSAVGAIGFIGLAAPCPGAAAGHAPPARSHRARPGARRRPVHSDAPLPPGRHADGNSRRPHRRSRSAVDDRGAS